MQLLHSTQPEHFNNLEGHKTLALRSVVELLDAVAMYKFAAAAKNESIVFGSARPGHRSEQVTEWIEFMQNQNIQRVCCLLSESELTRYASLLEVYQQAFGLEQICWTPIKDFHLATPELLLHQILPFFAIANQHQEKVVVYDSGGVGRVGHVLAAWLVAGRDTLTKMRLMPSNKLEEILMKQLSLRFSQVAIRGKSLRN